MLTCELFLQSYYFSPTNPYRDWPNAFAEGQEKAREGDLNAAVLLLEAAILQDPQDSEVTPWSDTGLVNHHVTLSHVTCSSSGVAAAGDDSGRERERAGGHRVSAEVSLKYQTWF